MRLKLAALAAPALLALSFVTPARAAVTQPADLGLCSWNASQDTNGDWTVTFSSGLFSLVDEDNPAVVHTGSVTCSIQETPSHTDADIASATGAPSSVVTSLPSTKVAAPAFTDPYFVCTQLDVDGTTLYWNDSPDRNTQGWWTTSTAARCENLWETLELRLGEDPPGRQVFTALAIAGEETDPVFTTVDPAICAAYPQIEDSGLYTCHPEQHPTSQSGISFVRLSAGGAVLRTTPYGWSCTDVHTGLAVTVGSLLTVPNPGVSCLPPVAMTCWRAEVTGALAPTVLGRVAVRSTCGNKSVERWLIPTQGTLVQEPSSAFWGYPAGSPPVTCTTGEDTVGPLAPAYAVICGVFTFTA